MSQTTLLGRSARSGALFSILGLLTCAATAQTAAQVADEKCAALSSSEYVKCISDAMAHPAAADPQSVSRKLDGLRQRKLLLEAEIGRINGEIRELEESGRPRQSAQTFYIAKFGIAQINSAGGVEPFAVLVNPDRRSPIKYLRIQATLYNAVGDVIGSSIGGKTTASLRFTGPLAYEDDERGVEWEPVWYNATGECVKIEAVQVTFMNERVLSFSGKSLRSALAPNIENECRVRKTQR